MPLSLSTSHGFTLGLLLLVLCLGLSSSSKQTSKPNVVVFYVDDMGWGDLGCYGHPTTRTPHVDRMAAEGMRFTQFYAAAPVCTPSRAALMTGRYPVRSGMTDNLLRVLISASSPGGLPRDEYTVAELFQDQGYSTGMVGKWHLGINQHNSTDGGHLPTAQGFDDYFGFPLSNSPACVDGNEKAGKYCFLYRNSEVVEQPMKMENLTQRFTHHAKEFMTDKVQSGDPFFFYFSFVHVHTALFAAKDFQGRSLRGAYGDNMEEMDWAVGEVMQHLKDLGVDQDTMIVFASDNGPYLEEGLEGGSAGILSGGKGQNWEGGIRVPGIFRWPSKIAPGQVTAEIGSTMDLLPTFASIIGSELPEEALIDGKDLSDVLFEGGETPHDFLFHYCGSTLQAVRHGPYKVHFQSAAWTNTTWQACPHDKMALGVCMCLGKQVQKHEDPLVFNVEWDPSERHPLTRDNFDDYDSLVAIVRDAADTHKNSVEKKENQIRKLGRPWLAPCCNPPSCKCEDPLNPFHQAADESTPNAPTAPELLIMTG